MDGYILGSLIGAAVGAAGTFMVSNLKLSALRQEITLATETARTMSSERDLARRRAALAEGEVGRLRGLFELPSRTVLPEGKTTLATALPNIERELTRLGRDARGNIAAVGLLATGLPLAVEGSDETNARHYMAAATALTEAADMLTHDYLGGESPGRDHLAGRITVDIAGEFTLRAARLTRDRNGLLLVALGPLGTMSEAAWGRSLYALSGDAGRAGRPEGPQISSPSKERTALCEGELPPAFRDALGRTGVRRFVRVAATFGENAERPAWVGVLDEALRRIPGAEAGKITLRVRSLASPANEAILVRETPDEWFVAVRDASYPDPDRILQQVAGFLRFQTQQVA